MVLMSEHRIEIAYEDKPSRRSGPIRDKTVGSPGGQWFGDERPCGKKACGKCKPG